MTPSHPARHAAATFADHAVDLDHACHTMETTDPTDDNMEHLLAAAHDIAVAEAEQEAAQPGFKRKAAMDDILRPRVWEVEATGV